MKNETLVVKCGSSAITNHEGMDLNRLSHVCEGIAKLHEQYNIVMISSGAVAMGRILWDKTNQRSSYTVSKQTLAMMGSARAFTPWQDELMEYGISSGQLLVTHKEVDDTSEGAVLLEALLENMENRAMTIGNENSALSIEELALESYGGENDGLALHVAQRVGAKAMILINSRGGIYDNSGIEISTVEQDDWWNVWEMADDRMKKSVKAKSKEGTGGIVAKTEALIVGAASGIESFAGCVDSDIQQILDGEVGTHFVAIAA